MDSFFVVPQAFNSRLAHFSFPKPYNWILLAGMGGAARFLSKHLQSKKPIRPFSFIVALLANCFISGFTGPITALYVSTKTDDHTWTLIAAGVGGYLGIEVLNLISAIFKSVFLKSE